MAREIKDMVGFRTGSLVVESRAEDHVTSTGSRYVQWACCCDCGEMTVKRGTALRNGSAKSCGCARSTSMMGKGLVDLSGQRFERWTVINRAPDGKNRQTMWNCVCDCGEKKSVNAKSLKNGESLSCGCLKVERLSKDRGLEGQRFGRWTVIRRGEDRFNKRRFKRWLCVCDCGEKENVDEQSLLRGKSTSCGCYRAEKAVEAANLLADDLRGQRFGLWTAVERAGTAYYPGGGQTIQWLCKCDCGIERVVLATALRTGDSQSCGCATGSRMEAHVRIFCDDLGLDYATQRTFKDLRGSGGRRLAFDFQIMTDHGPVLVECQGEQHFRAVEWFGGEAKFVEQVANDQAKRDYAQARDMPLVEIHFSVNTEARMVEALRELLGPFFEDPQRLVYSGK